EDGDGSGRNFQSSIARDLGLESGEGLDRDLGDLGSDSAQAKRACSDENQANDNGGLEWHEGWPPRGLFGGTPRIVSNQKDRRRRSVGTRTYDAWEIRNTLPQVMRAKLGCGHAATLFRILYTSASARDLSECAVFSSASDVRTR